MTKWRGSGFHVYKTFEKCQFFLNKTSGLAKQKSTETVNTLLEILLNQDKDKHINKAQNLLKKEGGGRVAVLEILIVTSAVASLVRDGKTTQIMSIMQTAKKEGMTLLNDELARFVKEEVVAAEEAWRKSVDKEGFLKALESQGVKFTAPVD